MGAARKQQAPISKNPLQEHGQQCMFRQRRGAAALLLPLRLCIQRDNEPHQSGQVHRVEVLPCALSMLPVVRTDVQEQVVPLDDKG